MERPKFFHVFKEGDLVRIVIDGGDAGLGIVVQEIDYINDIECFYVVYSMRLNSNMPVFPYELELVREH